ncbi:MAG: hypothetical protein RIB93_06490 [Coleofasciculus sp. D1-CHI-01]|uniref:hypothetical protein n=1 Tax=unclassified Coleofasciculus TaxID=2692782 RepID=UPI0032F1AD74
MATIKISNLNPVGSEFFNDSETYLNELNGEQLNMIQGGSTPACIAVSVSVAYSAFQLGRWWERHF